MKRHKRSGSCLPSGSGCLGNICGTNIDLEDIDFARQQSNLVYMDKVFSFKEDTSCPILFNLFTGGMQANRFTVELTLDSKDCDLIPCTLSPNAVFTIDNSFVVVEYFNTRPPGNINAGQVTADGFPVDSVSYSNGQYTAKTANLLPRIQHERCLNRGLPTKAFFLINNAGPWDFRARYILEGTVNTNGRNCCFRAEITNAPNSPNTSLPNSSLSSFAIPDLSLPCSIDGIAPDILFQFKANIHMVNPRLIVNCGNNRPSTFDVKEAELSRKGCCPPCDNRPINSESCTVFLETNLAVEPTVHVETIRKTLFCVDACEALKPCDGSVTAAERAQEEECIEGVTNGSDCRCGNNNVGGETDRDRDRDCCRDRDRDRDCDRDKDCDRDRDRDRGCNTNFTMPCGNRTVGGITIGTGPCFCNDGRVIREDRVGGARNCRRLLLEEICEALAGDVDCDCGDENEGLAADGTFGCGCDVRGTTDRDRDRDRNRDCDKRRNNGRDEVRSRTAFQFNGCNGCSW